MKRVYSVLAVIAAATLLTLSSFAQSGQTQEWCVTHEMYEQQLKNDPVFRKNQELLQTETEQGMRTSIPGEVSQKGSSVVRTIPVVVHVIHEGGAENISKAQIQNQIDILNEDFRRLNADTVATPAVFKPIAADSEIEFKLATLDPNGNCTDGVVRKYSTLSSSASPRDLVKAVSYWPSNKYFNIWIVKSIAPSSGTVGIVAGYAQFPGGNPLTDGIVLRHDFTGVIGTGSVSSAGRTATHEVGHWLNLRHIWGDANCGNDFVNDTPVQQGPNQTTCPSWPKISCNNGPNGEMFTNYMDYTRGNCQNIFSNGQAFRMNSALSSSVSGRSTLWSAQNLINTGTDPGANPTLCAPVAAFNDQNRTICEGTTVNFIDGSWNGVIDTWNWSFPGGTPSTSTDSIPTITYNSSGTYDVTLTVTNAAGTDTYTASGIVNVVPAVGQKGIPFSESFENITFPNNDWALEPGPGNTWEQNTLAAKTGANSVYINNHSGNPTGSVNSFVTPTYNFQWSTAHSMTFELAFAIRSTASTDQLRVFASTSCGQLWNVRYTKSGSSLATAGLVGVPFFPVATSQWSTQSVNIGSSSYNNKPNVRFKFEYTHDTGNNIFIDDINIDGTVGIDEDLAESIGFSVYPNPVESVATIDFRLPESGQVYIDVQDVMGRTVNKITEMYLTPGDYRFEMPADLANGLYNVRIFVDGRSTSKKILISK